MEALRAGQSHFKMKAIGLDCAHHYMNIYFLGWDVVGIVAHGQTAMAPFVASTYKSWCCREHLLIS